MGSVFLSPWWALNIQRIMRAVPRLDVTRALSSTPHRRTSGSWELGAALAPPWVSVLLAHPEDTEQVPYREFNWEWREQNMVEFWTVTNHVTFIIKRMELSLLNSSQAASLFKNHSLGSKHNFSTSFSKPHALLFSGWRHSAQSLILNHLTLRDNDNIRRGWNKNLHSRHTPA